jgi:hypothetical protein
MDTKEELATSAVQFKEKHDAVVSRLKRDKQIIIYNNQICITSYNGNSLVWVKDYYLYKINEDYVQDNWFHINLNYRHLINFGDGSDDERKTTMYYGFLNTVQFIDDTSDENIGKVHLELLKNRLINRVINTVSNQDIISREVYHRDKILKYISGYINQISSKIYSIVEIGIDVLQIRFDGMTEKLITNDGKMPAYLEYPCSDGKIRKTFSEYFYFLLEKLHNRTPDVVIDQEWIGRYLIERCNNIFPHIQFICKQTDSLLPIIILYLNIDTMDSLL